MKKVISFLTIILLFSLSANAQFCNKYADKAVAQYKLAKKNNLPNIILPFWTDDWNGHFNWCNTVPKDFANKHNELRQAYLDKFIKPAAINEKETFCNTYADKAIAQFNQAKQLFKPKGDYWSDDRESIYNWCMKVPKNVADQQQDIRQGHIDEYSDPGIPGNTSTNDLPHKTTFCNTFADMAIFQYNNALQLQIPDLIPPLWSKEKTFYLNRCLAQSENISNDENLIRQKIIDNYSSTKPKKDEQEDETVFGIIMDKALEFPDMTHVLTVKISICDHYAKESVIQNKVNLDNDCGFKGKSWSSDYNYHKNWAMHGSNFLQVDKNIADREKQLKKCMENDLIWIQGMVLGLRHLTTSFGNKDPFIPATKYFNKRGIKFLEKRMTDDAGHDLDDPLVEKATYLTVNKGIHNKAIEYNLPSGIVIGLGYCDNDKDSYDWSLDKIVDFQMDVPVFGVSASNNGPEYLPGGTFKKYCGGDLGAAAGDGWCWYESTGYGFNNWPQVNNLPRGTVIGLKHNLNQPNKKLIWQGVVFDPADPNIKPPPGFTRKVGGDMGAPAGKGYFWYEKITGE